MTDSEKNSNSCEPYPDLEVYVALVHYPVLNKKGDVICSAITNLDLHDIARASRTFGVKGYYVVSTLDDQKILADKIVKHWTEGVGGDVNPARREALNLIKIKESLEEVVDDIGGQGRVKVVATTARDSKAVTSFGRLKGELVKGGSFLILFGTAWGLADEVLDKSDFILEPLKGATVYNHLSVRSAVAIILDRLIAR